MTRGFGSALAARHGIGEGQCGRVAYDAAYLGTARVVLARMLDYAVNVLGYRLAFFWHCFWQVTCRVYLPMEMRRLLRDVRASSWHVLLCERRDATRPSCPTSD